MATPTGVYQTYITAGIREDLADIIYDISPTDTPFQSAASRLTATQTKHEWQTDALADAATNANIEGVDAVGATLVKTARLYNVTQIAEKTVIVSGTNEAALAAGRGSEMNYQVAKGGRELKRDMEFDLTQVGTLDLGTATAARTFAALETWIQLNVDEVGTAAEMTDGQPDAGGAGRIDGLIPRALTELILKDILQKCWQAGGDVDMIMCGGVVKQVVSSFTGTTVEAIPTTGIITRFDKTEDRTFYTAFEVYQSDFGLHSIVPNRFQRPITLFCLDMSYWGISYLRAFRQYPLAKTGDNVKRQLISEYTLCSKQADASGAVYDIAVP